MTKELPSCLRLPSTVHVTVANVCTARACRYDELGNYMTYNTPVCFAAVGHLTLAQVGGGCPGSCEEVQMQ